MAFLLLFIPRIKDNGGWGVENWGADGTLGWGVFHCVGMAEIKLVSPKRNVSRFDQSPLLQALTGVLWHCG
jgi:hypothetical protein